MTKLEALRDDLSIKKAFAHFPELTKVYDDYLKVVHDLIDLERRIDNLENQPWRRRASFRLVEGGRRA
jgi:hypothetical protein